MEGNKKQRLPWSRKKEWFASRLIKMFGALQVWCYEKTQGRVFNQFSGAPCAILTTVGRKSGKNRKTPLIYLRQNNLIYVVASNGGMRRHPIWYLNIKANPHVTIQVNNSTYAMIASETNKEAKDQLWPLFESIYPPYQEYRQRSEDYRDIPILLFEPI